MAALVGMRSRLLGCLKGSALVTLTSKHKIRSSHGSLACSLSVLSREFHFSAPVREGKYHYIEKKRKLRRIRMEDLKARYERLDEEDRPTGCFLCPMRTDVEVNYKNVRLLSQFVSPFSGRIYGRAVTGLCDKKQKEISRAIRRARAMGFMPVTMKYLEYHKDPKLF